MDTITKLKERFNREISHVESPWKAFLLRQKYHALYLMTFDRETSPPFQVTDIEYFDKFPKLIHPKQKEYWMVPELVEAIGEIDIFPAPNDEAAKEILNNRAKAAKKPWRLYQGKRFVGISDKEEENGSSIRPQDN